MEGEGLFVTHIMAFFVLFLVAICSGIFLKKIKFPYTIGLVVIGIIFAFAVERFLFLAPLKGFHLSHDLILYILLPTLIFEAAININSRLLVKNLMPVCALAIPGLVISMAIIGYFMQLLTPMDLGVAMLFGALISATDPVAVIALFKEVGAPKRLTMLVDGESLFNDATAIVAFNIVLAIILSGTTIHSGMLTVVVAQFFYVFIGGLIVGLIIGRIITFLINLASNEPLIQVALTTVTAYASFILADHYLGVSGVMSALGAGLVISWYGTTRFTHEAKNYMESFWEFASFTANSFIFLLLGTTEWRLLINNDHSKHFWYNMLITIVVVTLTRAVVVYGIIPLLKFLPGYRKISGKYQTVIFWGGLRGAVPLALVLSLNADFPYHQYIVEFTLAVVLFTLLVQGTTTKFLIQLFKLDKVSMVNKILALQSRILTIKKSKKTLSNLADRNYMSSEAFEAVKENYEVYLSEARGKLTAQLNSAMHEESLAKKLIWVQAVSLEVSAYRYLYDKRLISESIIRELELNAEKEIEDIEEGKFPELSITATPLDLRIRNIYTAFLKKLLPRVKYVQILQERTLVENYGMTIAMITADAHVRDAGNNIPKLYEKYHYLLEECQEFYKERANLAIEQSKRRSKYDDHAKLQILIVEKALLSIEYDTCDKMGENGVLPEVVVNILKGKLESQIDALKL